jgi:hypothetical protein
MRSIQHLARPKLITTFGLVISRIESLFQNEENGFFIDRRLRADSLIIRAQATIRTDGFFVRAGFANTCALRAPTSFFVRIHIIRTKNEVLQGNRMLRPLTAPKVNFEMCPKEPDWVEDQAITDFGVA